MQLLQHPQSPSIGNGAGVGSSAAAARSSHRTLAEAAVACKPQPGCSSCNTPKQRGLAAVQAHSTEATSPPNDGTKPTAWWHQAHHVVAPSPPHGGTKPIARWHQAHHMVAQAHREVAHCNTTKRGAHQVPAGTRGAHRVHDGCTHHTTFQGALGTAPRVCAGGRSRPARREANQQVSQSCTAPQNQNQPPPLSLPPLPLSLSLSPPPSPPTLGTRGARAARAERLGRASHTRVPTGVRWGQQTSGHC